MNGRFGVDVVEFEGIRYWKSEIGEDASPISNPTTAGRLSHDHRSSISLYHDDFLSGLYVDGAPDFEVWLRTERERLRLLLLEGLTQLSQFYLEQRNWEEAISMLRRQLSLEPWHETAHRDLMLALAKQGQVEVALAQYETCRQILGDELQITPSKATVDLADRISALRDRPRHNLPPQPTQFIGRKAELVALEELLTASENRLVTIVAPGGMGKTRLALAAAAEQTKAFLEGVAFVTLAPVESSSLLATSIVETLSGDGFIEPHQGHKRAADYLLDELANLEMLLVLDNYEQLLPDISLLLRILERAPQIKLLVTTRERLNTGWERPYPITGLPYPPDIETADWQLYSAPQLFIQTAQRVRPGLQEPATVDKDAIIHICRLVEGMPLALELAATWMRVQLPTAIAAEITDNLAILSTRRQDLPPRQRSMHAVFDQTWSRLTPSEQETLAGLSVFRGPLTFQAAQQVAGADWRLLAALVDKSLLRHHHESDTVAVSAAYYEMHELLRQYAAERLEEAAAVAETKQRHGQYYAQLLTEYESQLLDGNTQASTLKQMGREIDNIRAAWEWALSTHQGESINQMLKSLYRFYQLPSLVRDGLAVMADAAKKLAQFESVDDELNLAFGRVLARQGSFTWLLHEDYAEAERVIRQSSVILEKHNNEPELAFALTTLANIIYTTDLDAGRQYWQRSLRLYQKHPGYLARQSNLLRNLCVTAPSYVEMMHYWEQALATAVAGKEWRNEGHLYFIRGDREFQVGYTAIAQELTEKSVAIIRTVDDPPHLILALNILAGILTAQGQFSQAKTLVQEMEELADRLGIQWHSLLVTVTLGRQAAAEGRYEEAETHLDKVLASAPNERSYKIVRQSALFYYGRLKLLQEDYAAAREYWEQHLASDFTISLLEYSYQWRARAGIGETWLCEGDMETAVIHLRQAKELALAIGGAAAWEQELTRLMESYKESLSDIY